MLKITPSSSSPTHVTLRLEGRVLGPWVDIFQTSCRDALARYDRVTVDLTDVSFVDAAGVAALRELDSGRVSVTGCRGFIAHMLREVGPCS